MAIQEGYVKNLDMIIQAAKNGDTALMECTDAVTGQTVIALCAVYQDEQEQFNFVPLAKMFDGNPYEELNPPMAD